MIALKRVICQPSVELRIAALSAASICIQACKALGTHKALLRVSALDDSCFRAEMLI